MAWIEKWGCSSPRWWQISAEIQVWLYHTPTPWLWWCMRCECREPVIHSALLYRKKWRWTLVRCDSSNAVATASTHNHHPSLDHPQPSSVTRPPTTIICHKTTHNHHLSLDHPQPSSVTRPQNSRPQPLSTAAAVATKPLAHVTNAL